MRLLERLLGWVLIVVASAIPTGLCLLRGWHKEQIALTYSVAVVLVIVAWYARFLAFRKSR